MLPEFRSQFHAVPDKVKKEQRTVDTGVSGIHGSLCSKEKCVSPPAEGHPPAQKTDSAVTRAAAGTRSEGVVDDNAEKQGQDNKHTGDPLGRGSELCIHCLALAL